MKTLKQQLQAIQDETEEIYWNEESIIYAVKEWLTRKRQEYINTSPYFSHTKHGYGKCLDELLEELDQ